MTDQGRLRASDAEREHTGQALREHYAAGRISAEELSTRLDSLYAAATVAELGALLEDLPALPPSPAIRRSEFLERRARLRRQLLQQTGGSLGVFIVCVAIWLTSGADSSFWPVWVLIVPLLALARNGWMLYGPAPELDRVEAELRRHGRHRHRRGRQRQIQRGDRGR